MKIRPVEVVVAWLRWWLTGDCGYLGCGYTEPYGWVVEEGCPIHYIADKSIRLERLARLNACRDRMLTINTSRLGKFDEWKRDWSKRIQEVKFANITTVGDDHSEDEH